MLSQRLLFNIDRHDISADIEQQHWTTAITTSKESTLFLAGALLSRLLMTSSFRRCSNSSSFFNSSPPSRWRFALFFVRTHQNKVDVTDDISMLIGAIDSTQPSGSTGEEDRRKESYLLFWRFSSLLAKIRCHDWTPLSSNLLASAVLSLLILSMGEDFPSPAKLDRIDEDWQQQQQSRFTSNFSRREKTRRWWFGEIHQSVKFFFISSNRLAPLRFLNLISATLTNFRNFLF